MTKAQALSAAERQRLEFIEQHSADRAYARYSYSYMYNTLTPPLGNVLDGTPNFAGSRQHYMSQNAMVDETHVFTANLINDFRFGYNWGDFENHQANDLNCGLPHWVWAAYLVRDPDITRTAACL